MPLLNAAGVQALANYVADLDVSEDQPWMLQQLLQGSEFSSYSIAHKGHLVLHSDTEARASNLRYLDTNSREVRHLQRSTHTTQSTCMSPAGLLAAPVTWCLQSTASGTIRPALHQPDMCVVFSLHGCALSWHALASPL